MREKIDTCATKALVVIVAIVVPVMLILQVGLTIRLLQKGGDNYLSPATNIISYNNTTFSTTINYYNTTDYNSIAQENNHPEAPPATDAASPKIIEVHALPPIQLVDNNVTIVSTVIDDTAVESVKVDITGTVGFTPLNVTMTKSTGACYYYKNTYSIPGNYSYYIWANDTNGNANCSLVHHFQILAQF